MSQRRMPGSISTTSRADAKSRRAAWALPNFPVRSALVVSSRVSLVTGLRSEVGRTAGANAANSPHGQQALLEAHEAAIGAAPAILCAPRIQYFSVAGWDAKP